MTGPRPDLHLDLRRLDDQVGDLDTTARAWTRPLPGRGPRYPSEPVAERR